MFKNKYFSLLKYNKFTFGDQMVSQFVIFECKWLFSIIFFYFHKSDYCQDRYHTHAFNALSFKLWGEYTEYLLLDESSGAFGVRRRSNIFQFFPRDSYHKIGDSDGCCTLLLSGPWNNNWKEYINGTVVHYTWGREKDGTL